MAEYLGVEAGPYPGATRPLAVSLADVGPEWDRIVAKYGLRPNRVEQIAPWWHVDVDLCRTQETLTDMSRSRERGFLEYQRTLTAMTRLFDRLRRERIIP